MLFYLLNTTLFYAITDDMLTPQDTLSPNATADTAHSAYRQHCGHTVPPLKGREAIPRTRRPHSVFLIP